MRFSEARHAWLGQRPEHWDEARIGHICKILTGGTPDRDTAEYWINGTVPWMASGEVSKKFVTETESKITELAVRESNAKLLPPNSVMIALNGQGKTKGTVAVLKLRAACNQSLAAIVCDAKKLHYQYLFWCLDSRYADIRGLVGEDRDGLNLTHVREIPVYLPPLHEQRAIAHLLDHETAALDLLKQRKTRLRELILSRLASVVRTSVTSGIRQEVELVATGVEWLAAIPRHWELKRLGHVAMVVRGASPRPAGSPDLFDGDGIPWITVAEITKDRSKYLVETFTRLTAEGELQSRRIPSGTVVLTNSGATLGVPKILGLSGCINDGSVAFLRLSPRVLPDFLYYYLSSLTENYRERIKQGSGQPNLNTMIVKSTPFPLPSADEQRVIVDYLDVLCAATDGLIAKIDVGLTKLDEYRRALISAAVTGQIDVRNYRPQEAAALCP